MCIVVLFKMAEEKKIFQYVRNVSGAYSKPFIGSTFEIV